MKKKKISIYISSLIVVDQMVPFNCFQIEQDKIKPPVSAQGTHFGKHYKQHNSWREPPWFM